MRSKEYGHCVELTAIPRKSEGHESYFLRLAALLLIHKLQQTRARVVCSLHHSIQTIGR